MTLKTMNGLRAVAALSATVALAGCMGPTYGTGKTAGEQLFDDLDGIVSFADPRAERDNIDYSERPELVRPDNIGALPPPQANSATTELSRTERLQRDAAIANNGGPVSPELAEARAALRADPTPNRADDQGGSTQFAGLGQNDFALSPQQLKEQGAEATKRRAEMRGSPTQRRYLSEPPVEYRQPAATAPVGDPGLDESVKEARLKREENSLGTKLRNILPF